MTVERIKITSYEEWLQLRRHDITASVAGALLGVHEYTSAYTLFALKSGKIADDVEVSAPMIRGALLEPVALQLLRIERPDWKIEWNGTPGTISGDYYRDPEYRIGATPDAFAIDKERGPGIIQTKSVNPHTFRETWRKSDDGFGNPDEISPPLWIAVQAIIEAHLTGAQWAAVAPLVIGHGIDLHVIEVPIHTGIINRLREATADFWGRIARNDPPPPDFARDGETIARLYGQDNGKEVDLRGDNALPALLEERETLKATEKAASDRLDEIKAELTFKLGDNVAGYLPGWEITNKTTHRKGYEVKPTSYRSIRVKRKSTS